MKAKSAKKRNMNEILFILFGVSIPIIQWIVMYIYPNISSIGMAFMNSDGQLSLDNFARFFEEFQKPSSEIRIAFKNTFIIFGIGLVTYPLKVLVPYFIYKKVPLYRFYRIVFFLPSIIFSVAVANIFIRLVGVEGVIAQTIGEVLHLDYIPELLSDSQFANPTIWAHLLWMTFPGDLVIWGGNFARIPEDVLEAGKIDGTNWWKEFTHILFPLVWPTIALQLILMFCGIFGAAGADFLLTEGEFGTMTLSTWMYLTVYWNRDSSASSHVFNYMSSVGLLLTTVSIAVSLLIRRFTDKVFDDIEY